MFLLFKDDSVLLLTSLILCIIFFQLLGNEKYCNSKRVSIYLSRDIEVNTEPILNEIFKSGKECFIPKYE